MSTLAPRGWTRRRRLVNPGRLRSGVEREPVEVREHRLTTGGESRRAHGRGARRHSAWRRAPSSNLQSDPRSVRSRCSGPHKPSPGEPRTGARRSAADPTERLSGPRCRTRSRRRPRSWRPGCRRPTSIESAGSGTLPGWWSSLPPRCRERPHAEGCCPSRHWRSARVAVLRCRVISRTFMPICCDDGRSRGGRGPSPNRRVTPKTASSAATTTTIAQGKPRNRFIRKPSFMRDLSERHTAALAQPALHRGTSRP